MMTKIPGILLTATAVFFLLTLFFFWTNSIVDSYFYWALSEYFKTGIYPFQTPFIYDRATTISPPLYALFLAIVQLFPRADIAAHTLQLLMLGAIGFFLFRIVSSVVSASKTMIAVSLFLLVPAHVIYASYLLTELPSELFVTILLYLFFRYLKTKQPRYVSLAVFVAAVATLMKYSLIVYAFPALLWLAVAQKKKAGSLFLPAIGGMLLLLWVLVNWNITGTVGLSDTRGVQLYNQIVWTGGVLPDENHPAMVKLRQLVPQSVDVRAAYWDLQPYLLPSVHNQWSKLDTLLGNVAVAAVKQHPFAYIGNTVTIFFRLHSGKLPYWSNLSTFGTVDPVYPVYCGKLGSISMCRPMIKTPWSFWLWNSFIRFSNGFYRILFPIWTYGVFLPALLFSLVKGGKMVRALGLLYLVGVIPIAAYVHPDTRYLIPFYPFLLVIPIVAIKELLPRFVSHNQALTGKGTKRRRNGQIPPEE